jgi:1,2-diacylglycerol 3-beta-galactosyltransferase
VAAALTAAIESRAGGAVRCATLDLLRLSGCPLLCDAPALHAALATRLLPLYDLLYLATDSRLVSGALLDGAYRLSRRTLHEVLDHERPDLVVAAHPLVARLLARARDEAARPFGLLTLVTDLATAHASWALPGVDGWLVPSEEAYALLRRRGLPASRLLRCPFPVHPDFELPELSREAARRALGLELRRRTLLLLGGGVGAGMLLARARLLARVLPEAQLLVVAGRNEGLRRDLERAGLGPRARVFGYVEHMPALMAASDLVISKAGPGTIMEALALGRPFILTGAVGRQERGSIEYVLRRGLGVVAEDDQALLAALRGFERLWAAAVARTFEPPARLPESASRVAELLLAQLADREAADRRARAELVGAEGYRAHDDALGEAVRA